MIRKKLECIFIILLICLVILIDFMIMQTKAEIFEQQRFNFIDANQNLREYYLNKTLKQIFYEKYSEKSLGNIFNNENINGFKEWNLSIEPINLSANIKKGTSMEILNQYIGHFEETNFFNGNVGLAAHNRGYDVNYFKDLDKVKIGEYIYYRINDFEKKYKIDSINTIKDTDWTYLKETKEDIITLITCIKNKEEYRLCVQAHKESEEILNNAEKIFSSRYGNDFIIKCDFNRIC